jgi:hypothetical protein
MIPKYWSQFTESNSLIGKDIDINETSDLSGMGIELQIMLDEQCIDEATKAWPGIGVFKDGYFPVGMCLCGSGDYYYINTNDGASGPLYRIYHDAVSETGYEKSAIEKVLNNYEQLLSHTSP